MRQPLLLTTWTGCTTFAGKVNWCCVPVPHGRSPRFWPTATRGGDSAFSHSENTAHCNCECVHASMCVVVCVCAPVYVEMHSCFLALQSVPHFLSSVEFITVVYFQ